MNQPNLFTALEAYHEVQTQMDAPLFFVSVLTSLVSALVASGLYRVFYESRATGSQVHRAFPLLSISITTLFIAIQISIPLALGMLGTLSIIRFRTPIKEPEEIGFIMLVIASSVCAAILNFRFIIVLYIIALLSLILVRGARTWKILRRDGVLVLTLPDDHAGEAFDHIKAYLKENLARYRLESTSSREGITSIQLSFSGLKTDVVALQGEIRQISPVESVNVFLDRPGGIR